MVAFEIDDACVAVSYIPESVTIANGVVAFRFEPTKKINTKVASPTIRCLEQIVLYPYPIMKIVNRI